MKDDSRGGGGGGGTPFPKALRNLELGFTNKTATLSPKLSPLGFNDLHCQTLQSLETRDYLRLKVNMDSDFFEPIPIYCLEKVGDRLIASDESGQVHVIRRWFSGCSYDATKPPTANRFVSSTMLAQNSAVYTIKHIGGKLAAGTGNGHLCILDLDTLGLIRMYNSHEKSVKKVDSFNGDILVTCSRDNTINVHDLRVKSSNPVNTINNAHSVITADNLSHHPGGRVKPTIKASPSNSVTDVVFIDEYNLISSGAADGVLKQWDLRVTYKHMKKFHPVQVIEYPGHFNAKGFGCLKVASSKLFASTVQHEIFQFDLGKMEYEATYFSPSKLSYYTKLDVSHDGHYLASGSEEQKVHLFKTVPLPTKDLTFPIHTLADSAHDDEQTLPVCCVVFSPDDDLMLTTGGDSSIISKWIPGIYLYSSKEQEIKLSKEAQTLPELPKLKTELKYLYRRNNSDEPGSLEGEKSYLQRQLRLDSFPNYVIDGMRLPHVHPRIKIKLRDLTAATNWLRSPDSTKTRRRTVDETTPKGRHARKRKKLSDDNLSPKIFQFFKVSSSPTPTVV